MLADVGGSMAIAVRTERVGATSSVSVHCLAAARVGPLRATATMLHASKNSAVADVRVVDAGNDDRLVTVAHVTGGLFSSDA
ncbi:MAG TPA: hotdog domain-containing protein [Acidimicrobiales bacterium]|nr:hotdog domain-containing protein [Acidimicrobiales bacterium]